MKRKGLRKAQKVFKQTMEKFIEVNGRPVIVRLPYIYSDCPNCLTDATFDQEESINIYNQRFIRPVNVFPGTEQERIIYPQPFNISVLPSGVVFDPSNPNPRILHSTICPVCKGRGKLSVQPEVCINANFNWHPRSATADGEMEDWSAGRVPAVIGILKTNLCNYAIVREAVEFVVDNGVRVQMMEAPVKRGVGEDAHVEIYVQKVDNTEDTSRVKDRDPRLNIKRVASISEQADQSTPTTPPTIFADDEW